MYFMANGLASGTDDVTLFPPAAVTATTNGVVVDVRHGNVALTLSVTAASGTNPTLDVVIQTRKDADDSWASIGAFLQATGVTSERDCFAICDRQIRAVATIGGTGSPSFTFSVTGDAR